MGGLELIPTLTALVARMSRSTPALAYALKPATCRSITEDCRDPSG